MGKLLVIALLAGGGWWAVQNGLVPMPGETEKPTPAFEAYAKFSKYLAHDQYANAKRMAVKGAVRTVQIQEITGRRNTKRFIAGRALTKDDKDWSRKGDLLGMSHEKVRETTSPDGKTVTIEARARVCHRKSGCESFTHEVEACLAEQEWKVCSFRESPAPDAELAAR